MNYSTRIKGQVTFYSKRNISEDFILEAKRQSYFSNTTMKSSIQDVKSHYQSTKLITPKYGTGSHMQNYQNREILEFAYD